MKLSSKHIHNGLPQGVGTTSTGVYYDTRRKQTLRAKPTSLPSPRTAKHRAGKLSRAVQKRLLGTVSTALLVTGFAMVSILFGDSLWDTALQAQEAVEIPTVAATASPTPPPLISTGAASVWVPKSGTRYHKTDACGTMQEAQEVSLEQAKADGYVPCKRCNPPE